jgi:hypothetical protein
VLGVDDRPCPAQGTGLRHGADGHAGTAAGLTCSREVRKVVPHLAGAHLGAATSVRTAAAATPKAQHRALRWPPGSPTDGICSTTLPKRRRCRYPALFLPARTAPQPELAPLRRRQRRLGDRPGRADQGRHADIHAALAHGLTITGISRTLRPERKTARHCRHRRPADHRHPPAQVGAIRSHDACLHQSSSGSF